jgi:hypothetical protein
VPGEAGLRKTSPDPNRPVMVCVIVDPCLGTRMRFFFARSVADADDVLLVADDDEGGEREPPAALDHLGDAVDLHDPLLQVESDGAY